jgi:formylglycine-generating enzyme required for sulfatase activity
MKRALLVLCTLLAAASACMPPSLTPVAELDLPQIALIAPPSGTRIELSQELEIESRSDDKRGLNRIELWIDDNLYRVDEAEGQTSFHVIQRWRADAVGPHKIRIQALNVDGKTSQPASIEVQVVDPSLYTPTPAPTDTAVPTPTPVPPAETPTLAPLSTATATSTSMPTPTRVMTVTLTAAITPTATTEPTTTSTLSPTPAATRASTAPAAMIWIPAGKFMIGSNPDHVQQAAEWCNCSPRRYEDEQYLREVQLDGYYIDQYEVTNKQFQAFVNASGYVTDAEHKSEANTWRTAYTEGKDSHPVVWMSWNDARAYCKWAGKRLPSEAEWEKAARGTDARLWPWGNGWDGSRLNSSTGQRETTTSVGSFPGGASPYGAMDMAGNVWEWVNDWYSAGYYQTGNDTNPVGPEGGEDRVLRGGGYNNGLHDVRVANRHKGGQTGYAPDHGFRCAK